MISCEIISTFKKDYLVDIPVLLIFFNRPSSFEKVFEKVKEARPSKIFLACDGARIGNDDAEKIAQCKTIAESIDWNCELYKNYSEENIGCGMRPQTAITWALSIVDRIVILEDDCVPEISFFNYMYELLEKYKDDERIGMISGLNHLQSWNCGNYDYCFTKNGAIWGWGTWRRVWEKYDYSVSLIKDEHAQKLLKNNFRNKTAKKSRIKGWKKTNTLVETNKKLSYWDIQFGFLKNAQSYLAIVPKNNLICNIGVGADSTHATKVSHFKWKKGLLHFIPVTKMETPMKHPTYVICDFEYDRIVDKIWLCQNPFIAFCGRVKRTILRIWHKVF